MGAFFQYTNMAWTVDNIMYFFRFHLRKNQAGGISATDLFYAWNTEQTMYHNDIVGRWQAKGNGKVGNNIGMIQDETILTDLAPFTILSTIAISGGDVTKPSGFIYTADIRIGNSKVEHITPDQFDAVLNSVLDPPLVADSKYYYTEYEDYYYLLPHSVTGSVILSYIAAPTDIVWGYTIDGNGRQVYDVATSVQPQWNQDTIVTICKRALTSFGVSFKDQDFEQFGRTAQLTGD